MEGDELTPEAARQELIRLLASDDCLLTERAENEGKAILRRDGLPATERGIVAYVLKLLQANYPMHKIKRAPARGVAPRRLRDEQRRRARPVHRVDSGR
jgi:hypothetical protein